MAAILFGALGSTPRIRGDLVLDDRALCQQRAASHFSSILAGPARTPRA